MKVRIFALSVAVILTGSACGARLTPAQRASAIAGLQGGGAGGGNAGAEAAGAGGEVLGAEEAAAVQGPTGGAGAARSATGPARGSAAGAVGAAAAAAPVGGNGGATDKGVTGTEILVANLSDVSGPVPGLFLPAKQGIAALIGFANNGGGLFGRKLKLQFIDSKTDSGANNQGALEACEKAFALVGSMSAFDDGGAEPIDRCGIPDISAIPVNAPRQLAKNTFGAFPNRPDLLSLGMANYIKEKFPDVVSSAAIFYINGAVTRAQAARVVEAYQSVGYRFVAQPETQVIEPNYCPYVLDMRGKNVQYVTSVSDYPNIVRFLQAIRQCGGGWNPKVKDWNSVIYSPGFIFQGKQDAEGSLAFLNTALFEEAATNPEMQLYLQWLKKVAPDAKPDYFGLYAWSAGRLFLRAAQAVGPRLTRAKLIEELKKVHDWTSNGLHATHDVGNKVPSACFLYIKVEGGKFVRDFPAQGFSCDKGGLYKLKNTGA